MELLLLLTSLPAKSARMQEPNHNHHLSTTSVPSVNGGASLERSKPPQLPLEIPPGHVAFRLLFHSSRIAGVVGESDSIIKKLQEETSAVIRTEYSFPYPDDLWVIVIIASTSVVKKISLNATKRNQEEGELSDEDEEVEVSAAQAAVVKVFERAIEVAPTPARGLVSCRLLAKASQVCFLIGKGDEVVEKIRKDTGCKLKFLTSEMLQSCFDEMVEVCKEEGHFFRSSGQIEGNILAVKRALVAVTSHLQDFATAVEKARMTRSRQFEAVPQQNLPNPHVDFPSQRISVPKPMVASSSSYSSGGYPLSVERDRIPIMGSRTPQLETVFKILCPRDRVGGVIGISGSIVRTLQAETGSSIRVGPTIVGCDDRLITITAIENPDSRQSAAQNAVIRVFNKFMSAGPVEGGDLFSKADHISLRLVVPSDEVGCLLGKGGEIISELRKITGTDLWVIGSDQLPKCVSENDEVVQIRGEFGDVQNALYHVTGRLRDNLHHTKLPSSFITEDSPYGRVRDPSRLGLHPPIGVPQKLNQHNTLTQRMENLGFTHSVDRPPSPRLPTSQIVPGANQRSVMDGKGSTSVKGGVKLGSGSRSAIVTNTTLEILVPENVIGSVYGENSCNLHLLRLNSGATVIVREPLPGTTDRIVIITGYPYETQAALSLLEGFIGTGS